MALLVSNLGMGGFGKAHSEAKPRLTAAIIFLCAALNTCCAFLMFLDGALLSRWGTPMEVAAKFSLILFACASALVFFTPRLGYWLGLLGALFALPWFVQNELSWNSWVTLNYSTPIPTPPEVGSYLAFTKLKISSVVLAVVAVFCCLLRLLPARWSFRNSPLRRRTWPAFVIGFLLLAVWFGCSVVPYRVPGFDHPANAELRILNVKKRGLRFQETRILVYRDGAAWVSSGARWQFHYRFEERAGRTALAETSPVALEHARTFVQSRVLWNLKTRLPTTLHHWNAEGWYVVLKDSRLLAFSTEFGTAPPEEVTKLFHQIENLPLREERLSTSRDVCLGFCYDPVAALGFAMIPQRKQLLTRSASGSLAPPKPGQQYW